MRDKILTIENPQVKFDELSEIINITYQGFMALAMDYGYHIENVLGKSKDGKHQIYELRDNINYRIESSKLHFYLLLKRKFEIENRFSEMLKENPAVFNGYILGNPHFDHAADEIMSIFDSIIFHLSSSFDYLAMLTQFIFGQNQEKSLQWITLAKHCYNSKSEFAKRKFVENIKKIDNEFVSKFNDYRAELIHRKKSTSFANVSWELNSGKVTTDYLCSDKIKSNLKKVINKENDYCITYASYILIKESLLKIAYALEGMHDEFRKNYNPYKPIMSNGGFQLISINQESNYAETPSLGYWKKFMEYKNFI